LRSELIQAGTAPGEKSERVVRIATAYLRFAFRHPGLIRLIFGAEFRHRTKYTALADATSQLTNDIGRVIADPAAGLAAFAAMHGLAMLLLDNVIDLGQHQGGWDVIPSRAGILLRTLLESDSVAG
jgi:hypothetical protein